MRERELHSARQIVNALGGIKVTADLTDVSSKSVYHWLYIDQLPSHTYCIVQVALLRRGYYARPHLWLMTGFEPPKKRGRNSDGGDRRK